MGIYGWVALGFGLMLGTVYVFCGYLIVNQQRTINRLTDKLMAKDYNEYMAYQQRPEPEATLEPTRKPLSWHDDPALDEDETH